MYLHLGHDKILAKESVIGIFDLDKCSISKRTRQFLTVREKTGKVVNVVNEIPSSFIVCGDGLIYISQISTSTLKKRWDSEFDITELGEKNG